jgi:hypothetical protein
MRTEFKLTIGVRVWREIREFYSERSDDILRHDYVRPPPKSENFLSYWASTEWSCSKQQPVLLLVIVFSDVIYLHRSDTSHTPAGSDYRTVKKKCQCLKRAATLCTIYIRWRYDLRLADDVILPSFRSELTNWRRNGNDMFTTADTMWWRLGKLSHLTLSRKQIVTDVWLVPQKSEVSRVLQWCVRLRKDAWGSNWWTCGAFWGRIRFVWP